MYGYILESRVVGEPIPESGVVGEPIVACGNVFSFCCCTDGNGFQFPARSAENGGNGFQFPSLYRRKRFSVSGEFGGERRKQFSVSERSFKNNVVSA